MIDVITVERHTHMFEIRASGYFRDLSEDSKIVSWKMMLPIPLVAHARDIVDGIYIWVLIKCKMDLSHLAFHASMKCGFNSSAANTCNYGSVLTTTICMFPLSAILIRTSACLKITVKVLHYSNHWDFWT